MLGSRAQRALWDLTFDDSVTNLGSRASDHLSLPRAQGFPDEIVSVKPGMFRASKASWPTVMFSFEQLMF